jgi:5'-phosphate synthase pdxT subunit
MRVGVLALQGDFDAHRKRLEELGVDASLVRKPEQLTGLSALVIPGGESTTLLTFLEQEGFREKLREFVSTNPTFGTCAGAILLAKEVENPPQPSLGVLDIRISRNAYGRQIDSFVSTASSQKLPGKPLELVFIRAPKIKRVGTDVEVLAREGDDPVLVRQGNLMASTFHPELTPDSRVHQLLVEMACASGPRDCGSEQLDGNFQETDKQNPELMPRRHK